MTSIAHLLQAKGSTVWSIAPDASVYEAIAMMADKGVGALVVMDGDRLAGIVSERDYARKVILQGKSSRDTPVKEIMTARVITVQPNQTVEDCMALMTGNRIRHLPVLSDDHIVGIVSIGDLVKALLTDREALIEQLETYITRG